MMGLPALPKVHARSGLGISSEQVSEETGLSKAILRLHTAHDSRLTIDHTAFFSGRHEDLNDDNIYRVLHRFRLR